MSIPRDLSSGDAVVRAAGLCKSFATTAGPLAVLRGIDLVVARGQTVSVAGESGSGKSTLLALLAGLDVADSGTLEVGGVDLASAGEHQLSDFRSRTVGIVFQHFHLIRSLTALENVRLPLELRDGEDPDGRADRALESVGLGARFDHFPAQLSGGERQRVAIARALVGEPELLLADEPTGNLDEKTGGAVADVLFELVERTSTTLVLVTHSAALASRCARSMVLRDGRLHDGYDDALTTPREQVATERAGRVPSSRC
ncbi:MAG TPA: ABC transporter ATP-binding protein [Candidatus Limnocylindrales bacterium]|nr:ABC transporter ATP-binding protein [Candidatus Limnocylindrales bacterium]